MAAKSFGQVFACAILVWIVVLTATPAGAVIIAGGDGSGNTSAPADDPGWANVGWLNGSASAVYLGNQWVITAAHVGAGTVTLAGNNYSPVAGSWRWLHDPANPTQTVDLGLFQIATLPVGINGLNIISSTLGTGAGVLAIGNGRNRATAQTTWYVDTNPDPWVWSESWFAESDATADGFKYGSGQSKRWGENAVSGTFYGSDGWGTGNTNFLVTNFTRNAGNNEMQFAPGDSGGGVFFKNGSEWELAGIALAIDSYSGQPADTAVYGNPSYLADLSVYRSEILATVPEPGTIAMAAGVPVSLALLWFARRLVGRKKTRLGRSQSNRLAQV